MHRSRALASGCVALLACSPSPHSIGDTLGASTTDALESSTGAAALDTTAVVDDGTDAGSEGVDPPIFDLGGIPDVTPIDPDPGCRADPAVDATLTGTVYAPNGTLPISGAIVYTTTTPPLDLPSGVFCSECVSPPCDPNWTLTGPDGSFELESISGDTRSLVVRKGGFMRVTPLDIAAGSNAVPVATTTLPRTRDAEAGAFAPKIALLWPGMAYDYVWESLAEAGLADVDDGLMIGGSQVFDFFSMNGTDPLPMTDWPTTGSIEELVADPTWLEQYQILILPCMTFGWEGNESNIQDWVAKGGKLYATDLTAQMMDATFPQYQDFNAAAIPVPATSTVVDADLLAWFEALPEEFQDINPANPDAFVPFGTLNDLPEVVIGSASGTTMQVKPVLVPDGNGGQEDVGHRVFLHGVESDTPVTVRGEYGCGRVMYSTHHTAGSGEHVGLSALELALVYLLFELTTCQVPHTPPQG